MTIKLNVKLLSITEGELVFLRSQQRYKLLSVLL